VLTAARCASSGLLHGTDDESSGFTRGLQLHARVLEVGQRELRERIERGCSCGTRCAQLGVSKDRLDIDTRCVERGVSWRSLTLRDFGAMRNPWKNGGCGCREGLKSPLLYQLS